VRIFLDPKPMPLNTNDRFTRAQRILRVDLRKHFSKGFTLDDRHKPEISVIGGYAYAANPDKLARQLA
jgi:hypothetical protein